jgi:membrane fusion protein (multidrug efflux system)
MKTHARLWAAVILGLLVIVVLLVGTKGAQIGKMIAAGKTFQPPPESVTTTKVVSQPWQGLRSAVGSLVAVRGVTLGAELPGLVKEITFESGSAVRKGATLVRLDTSAEEAQLAAAKADAALAKLTLDRTKELRQAGSGTQAELDAAEARAKAATAQAAALEATIAKKTIRAPFDGRISIRQVELGQILPAGAPIASLQSVSPIHVDFWLPQQALADVKAGQKVEVRVDIFPGETWRGAVTTVNPEVDPATRNVRVRATVENPDGRLRPGMFASVYVLSGAPRETMVVPATAVLYAPYGDSVYVLVEKKGEGGAKDALVAQQRLVRLGERRGDFVAVEAGLKAGETIVSSGAFKLRNGTAVAVNEALAPNPELAPRPQDR